jgi:hypothetical protein
LTLGFLFNRPAAVGTVVEGGVGDPTMIYDSATRSEYTNGRALRQNLAGFFHFDDSFVMERYMYL